MRRSALGLLMACAGWPGLAQAQIYTRVNGNGVVEATNVPDTSDFRLAYPGKGTLIHSRGFRGSYSGEYDAHIEAAASLHGVSSALVRAVIAVESEFDRFAVSSKGAQGLMQLMPDTARRLGVADAFDARQNIFGGVQYLRLLLEMFNGNADYALAGYNAGENAVLRFGGIPPYKETQSYVRKVQALLSTGFRALTGPRPNALTPATPAAGIEPAASYAPATVRSARAAPASSRPTPAKPRVYYRFVDDRGVATVAQDPPPEGVAYSLIRALDR
jgi:hypothetical protein